LKWYKDQFDKATTDAAPNEEDEIRIESIYVKFLERL